VLRGLDDLGKRAEFLEQRIRERLGVAARDRREQGHFQELVIAQCVRARANEALA
jgi:hypothetical protein